MDLEALEAVRGGLKFRGAQGMSYPMGFSFPRFISI